MKVSALIEHLASFPPTAEVSYEDANFGGASEPVTPGDVKLSVIGEVLIRCPFWEHCE